MLSRVRTLSTLVKSGRPPLSSFLNMMFDDDINSMSSPLRMVPAISTYGRRTLDVDLLQTPSSYKVVCDMPGVKKSDIHCYIDKDQVLHITGEKQSYTAEDDVDEQGTFYHRMERSSEGMLKRQLKLPSDILEDDATCKFQDSVLSVNVPKAVGTTEPRTVIPVVED